MIKALTGVIIAGLLLASTVFALEVPPLAGRINDHARMLSAATVERLERELVALESRDSTQIVVLTIPSLDGDNIETFGIRVAESWKIGQRDVANGAILIISQADRKVRIEVGRGLEGTLTDLISGQIIRSEIVPLFKQNRFDDGIQAGVSAMIKVVAGEYKAKEPPTRKQNKHRGPAPLTLLLAVAVATLFVGSISKWLGGVVGAIGTPLAAAFYLPGIGMTLLAGLALVGFVVGLLLPLLFGGGGGYGGPFWWGGGGFGGGFGGGGGSDGGDGGFSGGGGDFGGGGASGDW